MHGIISNELILAIKDQLEINWSGIHGFSHLARVYENGLRLAESTGACKRVVQLFAVFHDSRRCNESWDPGHVPRGARLAESWRGKYFELPDDEFDLLFTSCTLHTKAKTHVDRTIQTCFDADRLDLGRVGKKPDPKLLCTEAARDNKTIEWAIQRSVSGYIPDNILGRALQREVTE
jgi:uncharacterized protein